MTRIKDKHQLPQRRKNPSKARDLTSVSTITDFLHVEIVTPVDGLCDGGGHEGEQSEDCQLQQINRKRKISFRQQIQIIIGLIIYISLSEIGSQENFNTVGISCWNGSIETLQHYEICNIIILPLQVEAKWSRSDGIKYLRRCSDHFDQNSHDRENRIEEAPATPSEKLGKADSRISWLIGVESSCEAAGESWKCFQSFTDGFAIQPAAFIPDSERSEERGKKKGESSRWDQPLHYQHELGIQRQT